MKANFPLTFLIIPYLVRDVVVKFSAKIILRDFSITSRYGGNHPPNLSLFQLTRKFSIMDVNRENISYECRFGAFGVLPGQFAEPSGVAITLENDIAVTDTNNH